MVVHVLELEEVDGEDNLMLEMKTVQSLEVSMSPSSTRMGSSSDSDLSELEDL